MGRADGEDWLEGRPFTVDDRDPAEVEEARSRLRDPRWWAVVLVVAVLVGEAWEAVGALLGDGRFDFPEGLQNATGALVFVITTEVVMARARKP